MTMQDRLDPLIAERAPWLFRPGPMRAKARRVLDHMLHYDRTVALAETLRDMPGGAVMHGVADLIAQDVRVQGLEHLPRTGPALVVANHPTGIADGLILWNTMARLRPDMYYYANRDILRVLPQLEAQIAPVEWRPELRSHAKARATMAFTRKAVAQGRLGVIFPSGRLAKRRGLALYERPWMSSAAMIARKFDLPVIPVNIQARNSALFYLFDALHPTLRDITLFHETLNKADQSYCVTLGRPIPAARLSRHSEDAIEDLRSATLRLGDPKAQAVSLMRASRSPAWVRSAAQAAGLRG